MERLRFGRSKKSSGASPTAVGDSRESSGKTTPEPGLTPPPPQVPVKKPSPFRGLKIHRSTKRARSPGPATLPQSPSTAAAIHAHEGALQPPPSSPVSVKRGLPQQSPPKDGKQPKIPSFLTLSPQEIDRRFQDIVWQERNRLMQSMTNPSPDFQWARVSGPIKHLDRYMNIQPWHNNRVKLRVPPGRIDYINASPITLTSPSDGPTSPPDRYIAMQGPKQSSIDHVWRMVVEQLDSPGVIVMLTETHEANMEKCALYFPRTPQDAPFEINAHDEFGDGFRASVVCESVEPMLGDAIELRKLVVTVHRRSSHAVNGTAPNGSAATPVPDENGDIAMLSPRKAAFSPAEAHDHGDVENGDIADVDHSSTHTTNTSNHDSDEERVIWHFLYKKWPDFGVPNIEDLDSFFALMRLSREKNANPSNPRIVHCSAGVGRSGTFIALEHLIRALDAGSLENYDAHSAEEAKTADHKDDDDDVSVADDGEEGSDLEGKDLIFSTVNQLREQRRTMVQAEAQYLFIYQVMRKLWQDKYGAIDDEPAAKRLEYDPFVEE